MISGMNVRVLPYGFMRLSDLLNFSVYSVVAGLALLTKQIEYSEAVVRDLSRQNENIDTAVVKTTLETLEAVTIVATEFEMNAIVDMVARFERKLEWPLAFGEFLFLNISLRDSIEDGLKGQFIYRYSPEQLKILKNWKVEWKIAKERFPDAAVDILALVDLWAMEHYTASVFHAMRVLEVGLGHLANNLNVKYDIQTWGVVLNEIEKAIREESKNLPRGAEKNERLQLLSELAKEFTYFKDGWRNHVSHNKHDYDEHEARLAMEHVRSFMDRLAREL